MENIFLPALITTLVLSLIEMIVFRVLATQGEYVTTSLTKDEVAQVIALRQVRWVRTDDGRGNLMNLKLRSSQRYIISVDYDPDEDDGPAMVSIGLTEWRSMFGLFASSKGLAPFVGWNIWVLKRKMANRLREAEASLHSAPSVQP